MPDVDHELALFDNAVAGSLDDDVAPGDLFADAAAAAATSSPPIPLEEIFDNLTVLLSNYEVAEVLRGAGARLLFGGNDTLYDGGGFGNATATMTDAATTRGLRAAAGGRNGSSHGIDTGVWETGRILVPVYSIIFLLSVSI
jgi:hypothetical protein